MSCMIYLFLLGLFKKLTYRNHRNNMNASTIKNMHICQYAFIFQVSVAFGLDICGCI